MVLTVPSWDIERSLLWGISEKQDTSLIGKSFRLPPLGYVVGDILSLNFRWDNKNRLLPIEDDAWFDLLRNNIQYCDIAKAAEDQEDIESETQISGTIFDALKKFFDLVADRPEQMNFFNFEMFLAFLQIPEPIPQKRLVARNFWVGSEDRADVLRWNETIDKFNRNEGREFFNALKQNNSSIDLHCNYEIRGFADLALVSTYLTLKAGKILVPCAYCGRLFTPSRVGEIYCSRFAPNERSQTCKEAAKYEKQLKRERASESGKIYKSVNTMLAARINFAKNELEEAARKRELEDFRDKARVWRSDIKKGSKTEEEYIVFLNSYKKRNKQ